MFKNTLVQRLAEQAKVKTDERRAPTAVDKTGFMTRTEGPAIAQFPVLAAQPAEADDDGGQTTAEAADETTETSENQTQTSSSRSRARDPEIEELRKQLRDLQSSHSQAGRIDNETLLKAQQWEAHQAAQQATARTPARPELSGEALEIYNTLKTKPAFAEAYDRFIAEKLESNERIKSLADSQAEIKTYMQNQGRSTIQNELNELGQFINLTAVPEPIAARVRAIRQNPAFEGQTVKQIYEMVTGKVLGKSPKSPTAKPPAETRAESRVAEPIRQPRTRDFNEAARRAAQLMNQEN